MDSIPRRFPLARTASSVSAILLLSVFLACPVLCSGGGKDAATESAAKASAKASLLHLPPAAVEDVDVQEGNSPLVPSLSARVATPTSERFRRRLYAVLLREASLRNGTGTVTTTVVGSAGARALEEGGEGGEDVELDDAFSFDDLSDELDPLLEDKNLGELVRPFDVVEDKLDTEIAMQKSPDAGEEVEEAVEVEAVVESLPSVKAAAAAVSSRLAASLPPTGVRKSGLPNPASSVLPFTLPPSSLPPTGVRKSGLQNPASSMLPLTLPPSSLPPTGVRKSGLQDPASSVLPLTSPELFSSHLPVALPPPAPFHVSHLSAIEAAALAPDSNVAPPARFPSRLSVSPLSASSVFSSLPPSTLSTVGVGNILPLRPAVAGSAIGGSGLFAAPAVGFPTEAAVPMIPTASAFPPFSAHLSGGAAPVYPLAGFAAAAAPAGAVLSPGGVGSVVGLPVGVRGSWEPAGSAPSTAQAVPGLPNVGGTMAPGGMLEGLLNSMSQTAGNLAGMSSAAGGGGGGVPVTGLWNALQQGRQIALEMRRAVAGTGEAANMGTMQQPLSTLGGIGGMATSALV